MSGQCVSCICLSPGAAPGRGAVRGSGKNPGKFHKTVGTSASASEGKLCDRRPVGRELLGLLLPLRTECVAGTGTTA